MWVVYYTLPNIRGILCERVLAASEEKAKMHITITMPEATIIGVN